ncbi:MAG TPA: phosphatase PAP2 family protein [Pseudolabrys sp.]|nr:phosphatase PAP2 family protein [Pseudolabrys sp.]
MIGLGISLGTQLTFAALPNIWPLMLGVVAWEMLSHFAPQSRVSRTGRFIVYGFLFLVLTCIFAVIAAYAVQRLVLPLQDKLFTDADAALGMHWFAIAYWVDAHPAIATILSWAYFSMSWQIALPLFVLAAVDRLSEVRVYLLAIAIALVVTTIVSGLLPAESPIALVERSMFRVLRFTGATPIEHLMRLRTAAPLRLTEGLGGIVSFPSFHATVAWLTPLMLRRYRYLLGPLIVVDALMLCATVTEGAHYGTDVIAGSLVAFVAYALARRLLKAEARLFHIRRQQTSGRWTAASPTRQAGSGAAAPTSAAA